MALVAMAYLTSEAADGCEAGGALWHVFAGLALLLLFVPHLLARRAGRHPHAHASGWQTLAARLTHVALLLFVVVQPLLGIVAVRADGNALPVPFTPWQIAPLVTPGEAWRESLEDLHETVGNAFYAVIAVHALAALWHQFAMRDDTLRRMW